MSGFLKRRVSLWRASRGPDGGGGFSRLYTEYATVWAAVDRLAAVRDFGGDRTRFARRAAATVRARGDVTLGDRFRVGGVFYDIVSIEAGEARETLFVLIGEEALS